MKTATNPHKIRMDQLIAQGNAVAAKAKAEGRRLTQAETQQLQTIVANAESAAEMVNLSNAMGDQSASSGGLKAAIMAAGFDRKSHPFAEIPISAAASFDGSYADAHPEWISSPHLGADERHLYPQLNTQGVDAGTTSVPSFRQKSRTLADPGDMVRDLVAVSAKPETNTQTELVSADLKQIATVQSAVPNIFFESAVFDGWINTDLELAFSNALDAHVIEEILDTDPESVGDGDNLLEMAVHGAEVIASEGYNPSILAASPADLISLKLLRQPESEDYVAGGMDSVLSGLRRVAVPGLETPMVLDPNAAGCFYISEARFQVFEENSGKTNTSTARLEATGIFVVQRASAIVLLEGSS